MSFFTKQGSSRIIKMQMLANTQGAAVCSAPFGPSTQQIRVTSNVSGFGSVDQSTSSTGATSAGTGIIIPAHTTGGEYFTVTPSMVFTFASSSTSSGLFSVTEMG